MIKNTTTSGNCKGFSKDSILEALKNVLPNISDEIDLKSSGEELKGPCPFCGGEDRFWVSADGKGHCRKCTPGTITNYSKIDFFCKKHSFPESEWLRLKDIYLGDTSSYTPERQQSVLTLKAEPEPPPSFLDEWESRCLTQMPGIIYQLLCDIRKIDRSVVDRLIQSDQVRFANHRNVKSVAFAYRTLAGDDIHAIQYLTADGEPYFFTVKNGNPVNKVFGKDHKPGADCFVVLGDIHTAKWLIICESIINAITAYECFPDACCLALGGSTYVSKVKALKPYYDSFEKVIICGDKDDASEKMIQAIYRELVLGSGTNRLFAITFSHDHPKGYDINDLLKAGQKQRIIDMVNDAGLVVPLQGKDNPAIQTPEAFWDRESERESPYPVESLPELARDAVNEYLKYQNLPVALVGTSALMVMNLVSQVFANVARDNQLIGPISLAAVVEGKSGERKTTVDSHFTEAIKDMVEVQKAIEKPAIRERNAEIAAWKSKTNGVLEAIKAASKKGEDTKKLENKLTELSHEEPQEIRPPVLFYGDINPASLGDSLTHSYYPMAALWSDEAGNVVGGDGMRVETAMLLLSMIDKLWDSGKYENTRKTVRHIDISGKRLCVSLLVQPVVFEKLKEGGLAQSIGFFSRCLTTSPTSKIGFRPYIEPPPEWPAKDKFLRRTYELFSKQSPLNEDGKLDPPVLKLSPEAYDLWQMFYNSTEEQLRPLNKFHDVQEYVNKIAENAVRIAATFHVFQNESGLYISKNTMYNANLVALWYFEEALRVFGTLPMTGEEKDAQLLLKWILESDLSIQKGYVKNAIPKSDLLRFGPSRLRKKGKRDSAIKILCENHWVVECGKDISLSPKSAEMWKKYQKESPS